MSSWNSRIWTGEGRRCCVGGAGAGTFRIGFRKKLQPPHHPHAFNVSANRVATMWLTARFVTIGFAPLAVGKTEASMT